MTNNDQAAPPFDEGSEEPRASAERLIEKLAVVHPQAAAIVTGHAALELEVYRALSSVVARSDKLPRLSGQHALGMLRALWEDGWLDSVLDAISAFGAVRNSVAHGDSPTVVEAHIQRLRERLAVIGVPLSEGANYGMVAVALASALHIGMER